MTRRDVLLVESDGEQIGVEVCGDGPPIVLLHGAGGNRATWFRVVPLLADDHTVVVVEARGAGRSTDRATQSGPVAGVADLEAVRSHLGLPAWHVVGHSLGGWTALRLARDRPQHVLSCALVSSVAGLFPPPAEAHWRRLTASLATGGWAVQELGRPPSLTGSFCDSQPELGYLYQLVGALNPPQPPTVPAAQIRSYDVDPDEVARLPLPIRFLVGDGDQIAPAAVVRAVAATVQREVVELPGAGHLPQWEDPVRLAAALRELVASAGG